MHSRKKLLWSVLWMLEAGALLWLLLVHTSGLLTLTVAILLAVTAQPYLILLWSRVPTRKK